MSDLDDLAHDVRDLLTDAVGVANDLGDDVRAPVILTSASDVRGREAAGATATQRGDRGGLRAWRRS